MGIRVLWIRHTEWHELDKNQTNHLKGGQKASSASTDKSWYKKLRFKK